MVTGNGGDGREPEIDVLGRVAKNALRALRWISIVAGLAAIAAAVYIVGNPALIYSEVPPTQTVIAHLVTLLCIGLPLALPMGFSLGRGRWCALALGAALWFGPMLLAGDHTFGFVLRMFASLVAISILAVWRTLSALSNPTNPTK